MAKKVKHPVDMAILDKDLDSIIIIGYGKDRKGRYNGGRIYERNHLRDTSDPDVTVYRFFELEKNILLEFLEPYKNKFEYEVLDSKTGEPIIVNKLKRKYTEPNVYSFTASQN